MNTRELVAVVLIVLVGSLMVFWPRNEDESDGRPFLSGESGKEQNSRDAGSGEQVEESGRKTRSQRVIKEKSEKITTESGLQYEVLVEGEGDHPGPSSTVKVHYVGTFKDRTTFGSSRDRGQPALIPLNGVITGWNEGLQLMKPGGVTRFVIPPELAYGDKGLGKVIPGGATLTFEIELISIEKP